jgi:hypothetical protein
MAGSIDPDCTMSNLMFPGIGKKEETARRPNAIRIPKNVFNMILKILPNIK